MGLSSQPAASGDRGGPGRWLLAGAAGGADRHRRRGEDGMNAIFRVDDQCARKREKGEGMFMVVA